MFVKTNLLFSSIMFPFVINLLVWLAITTSDAGRGGISGADADEISLAVTNIKKRYTSLISCFAVPVKRGVALLLSAYSYTTSIS